ncbi:MAG: hypothetical protein KJP00_08220 [Bacteroidia bacterium]|nr:hypothetical protein [Bacteroidia bacterium]
MKKSNNDFRYVFTSVTRNSDLEQGFEYEPLDKEHWSNGDFVLCRVTKIGGSTVKAELPNGRMMLMMEGDLVIGAFGVRHATLEATGTWKEIGNDRGMHLLTGAGLIGKMTSRSAFVTKLVELEYLGHIFKEGVKKNMLDYTKPLFDLPFNMPVILFVGTSMSSGKTTSARIVARQLKRMNHKVACAKLTGAGRYRDIISVKDAGADYVCDFIDAGLPSSICPPDDYAKALKIMLGLLAKGDADIAVVEIGASPLEPYNGATAIQAIRDNVVCTILCASDPYAVLGVMEGFGIRPDIVSGPAVNTIAGVELIRKLCKVDALNLIERKNLPVLRGILEDIMSGVSH